MAIFDVDLLHEMNGQWFGLRLLEFNESDEERRVFRSDQSCFVNLKIILLEEHEHPLYIKRITLIPQPEGDHQYFRFDMRSTRMQLFPIVSVEQNATRITFDPTAPNGYRLKLNSGPSFARSFPCILDNGLFSYLYVDVHLDLTCLDCHIDLETQSRPIELLRPEMTATAGTILTTRSVRIHINNSKVAESDPARIQVNLDPIINLTFPFVFFTLSQRHNSHVARFFRIRFHDTGTVHRPWNPGTDSPIFTLQLYVPQHLLGEFTAFLLRNKVTESELIIEGPWGLPLRHVPQVKISILFP